MMSDNSVMETGSDNRSPHPLAEISYVIGGVFVDEFRKQFWELL